MGRKRIAEKSKCWNSTEFQRTFALTRGLETTTRQIQLYEQKRYREYLTQTTKSCTQNISIDIRTDAKDNLLIFQSNGSGGLLKSPILLYYSAFWNKRSIPNIPFEVFLEFTQKTNLVNFIAICKQKALPKLS